MICLHFHNHPNWKISEHLKQLQRFIQKKKQTSRFRVNNKKPKLQTTGNAELRVVSLGSAVARIGPLRAVPHERRPGRNSWWFVEDVKTSGW